MAQRVFFPDPKQVSDVLTYALDWTTWLVGDTIATSTWTIEDGSGLTQVAISHTDTIAYIKVSGGTVQADPWQLVNTIETTTQTETKLGTLLLRVVADSAE